MSHYNVNAGEYAELVQWMENFCQKLERSGKLQNRDAVAGLLSGEIVLHSTIEKKGSTIRVVDRRSMVSNESALTMDIDDREKSQVYQLRVATNANGKWLSMSVMDPNNTQGGLKPVASTILKAHKSWVNDLRIAYHLEHDAIEHHVDNPLLQRR